MTLRRAQGSLRAIKFQRSCSKADGSQYPSMLMAGDQKSLAHQMISFSEAEVCVGEHLADLLELGQCVYHKADSIVGTCQCMLKILVNLPCGRSLPTCKKEP